MSGMDGQTRLRELYEQQWRALFGYAARRCDSAEDAADLVSEVFLIAWRRIDEVPHGPPARLWLFGVARLTLQNHLRGQRRRDHLGAALLAAFTEQHGDDPSRLFERDETNRAVRAALAQLPQTDRELLTLTAWEQLSLTDAAQTLGVSAVAARARLSRARRRLRALLDEDALPRMTLLPEPDGLRNTR